MTSPNSDLQIHSSNYGFIADYGPITGFNSPRDVFLLKLGRDSFNIRRSRKPSFEVFQVQNDSSVHIYFLMNNPEWGQCYERLWFKFEKGKYDKHSITIDRVIESFRPRFFESEKPSEK